jgi:hypothetical protein
MPRKGAGSSLAPLAADTWPECVSLEPSLSSGRLHLLSLVRRTRRIARLLRPYSCWARHGGRSTGSLRPASAINEEPFVGFNYYTLTEEDDDTRR